MNMSAALVVESHSRRRCAVVLVGSGDYLSHDESGNKRAEDEQAFDGDAHRGFSCVRILQFIIQKGDQKKPAEMQEISGDFQQ